MAVFTQDPNETIDYHLDWSSYLTSIGGATISTVAVTADAELTVDSSSNSDTVSTSRISIATATVGKVCNVIHEVDLSDGQIRRWGFAINIREVG